MRASAVSKLACDLHFLDKIRCVFQFLAIFSCGFAVSIDGKHSRSFLWSDNCKHVASTLCFFRFKVRSCFFWSQTKKSEVIMLSMLASGDFLRSSAVFAKISCGDVVSGTSLTPPVGGDGFFPP